MTWQSMDTVIMVFVNIFIKYEPMILTLGCMGFKCF